MMAVTGTAIYQELMGPWLGKKASFFPFDYLDPAPPIDPVDRPLVFTMRSIDQVCQIDARLLGVIASAAIWRTGEAVA